LFVKVYFPGEGELEDAFSKGEGKGTLLDKDFPHFEIVCKPKELIDFAKRILNFYSADGNH
jgi:hypothetical protein